jgi:hypothetical protein
MSYRTFKEWLITEKKDIFGFEKDKNIPQKNSDEGPVKHLDEELLFKELLKPVGNKQPEWNFFDQITWGEVNLGEALRLDMSPLGSFKLIIRKITKDLEGHETWVCKEIMPLPDGRYTNEETSLAMDVFKILENLNEHPNESPKKEYDLEQLTLKLAGQIKAEKPCHIMIFDKIKKMNENHYIVAMNFMGGGIEAPGSAREEQFHIHMFFDKNRGLIRSYGTGIESRTKVHQWRPTPSEWDEHFAPTQSKDEINQCIVNALSTY